MEADTWARKMFNEGRSIRHVAAATGMTYHAAREIHHGRGGVAIHDYVRTAVLFDLHVPHHDPYAVRIAKAILDDWKPTIVVAGGDWLDCSQLSDFATDDESDISDDIETVGQLLTDFHVTHWLEGNHEERIRREGAPHKRLRKLLDLSERLKFTERGIATRPYDNEVGFFEFGKLKILHGFYFNEYFARKTADTYGCCMFGHAHRFQTHHPKHAFEKHTGFGVGCLCRLDMPYTKSKAPRGWTQGFAMADLNTKTGNFSPHMVRLVGGEVVVNGKAYS